MTTPTVEKTTQAVEKFGVAGGRLASDKGTTTIAHVVVQKVAGLAAQEIRGVHALGGGTGRALSALRDRIPGATGSAGQGVSVEVGEKEAAVDLDLVVDYGVPIADLAKSVRTNVITAIEQITGLEVVEVNINVNDVHIPSDNTDDDLRPETSRVL